MRNNDKFCFFLLPEFILGVPKYDMVECTSYVIEKLVDNGFILKYTHQIYYLYHGNITYQIINVHKFKTG